MSGKYLPSKLKKEAVMLKKQTCIYKIVRHFVFPSYIYTLMSKPKGQRDPF